MKDVHRHGLRNRSRKAIMGRPDRHYGFREHRERGFDLQRWCISDPTRCEAPVMPLVVLSTGFFTALRAKSGSISEYLVMAMLKYMRLGKTGSSLKVLINR